MGSQSADHAMGPWRTRRTELANCGRYARTHRLQYLPSAALGCLTGVTILATVIIAARGFDVDHCHLVQFVVLSRTASRSSSARLAAGLKEATSMERSPAVTATPACSTLPAKRMAVPGGGTSTTVGAAVRFKNSFWARPGGPASAADQNAVPPPMKCSPFESGTRIVSDCSSRLRAHEG